MFDVAPAGGMDFNRWTNKELYEHAQDNANDARTLAAIRAALASRKKPDARFARKWIDERLSLLERAKRPKRWYHSKLLHLSLVALGAAGVGIGQGAGATLWGVLWPLVTGH